MTVLRNDRGMSLLELLIALVILLIVSMALMQTSLLVTSTNMQNALRDEAVAIADQRLSDLRNTQWTQEATDTVLLATSPTGSTETTVTKQFRGINVDYTPKRIVTDINGSTKQVTMVYTWSYKNKQYEHRVSTILTKQD